MKKFVKWCGIAAVLGISLVSVAMLAGCKENPDELTVYYEDSSERNPSTYRYVGKAVLGISGVNSNTYAYTTVYWDAESGTETNVQSYRVDLSGSSSSISSRRWTFEKIGGRSFYNGYDITSAVSGSFDGNFTIDFTKLDAATFIGTTVPFVRLEFTRY